MKIYIYKGSLVWFKEDEAPADAIPYAKPKKAAPAPAPEKITEEPKAKAKKTTANKARKAGANK